MCSSFRHHDAEAASLKRAKLCSFREPGPFARPKITGRRTHFDLPVSSDSRDRPKQRLPLFLGGAYELLAVSGKSRGEHPFMFVASVQLDITTCYRLQDSTARLQLFCNF